MRRQIITLARFTFLEALRTRLFFVYVVGLASIFALTFFIQQVAITEASRIEIAFSAAITRLLAVFLLSLHVITSVVRELDDKGLELTLSFDLRRSDYILGRLLGFVLIAVLVATLAALSQSILAAKGGVLAWGVSLALELVIMAALSLFCIVTFTQLMPAMCFVTGFYIVARALSAIRLISKSPLSGESPSQHVMSWLVDTLALVLPGFDRYAPTAWLADGGAQWSAVGTASVEAAIYTSLLCAAATFDFYRRNV
jgi:ABC-type transport system involved in multi-copper enzyme maturation permease subunit